ncbi:MAG TPA: hypothetical protein ENI76_07205 [Ignavibacteria bacterium]|nr:hypothetical protein [Ignavibacteria bacterium]
MFIKNWEATSVENTKKVKMICGNCGNETEHHICEVPGFGVGLIFMKKPILATKKYYFVCPICNSATKQITKEQVKAHKL